ncbi:glycosyltransferase [Ancylomarina salipaludis]|uniref:Glycosyltransferase n=1 Tax=Ancylomarina salipaludis TaxID=2501299 RepID=A0A4Q1JRI3_9BACT|nr:glycosyltransferase [Ancylomarina salipaludis]RXQ97395.1 glycosyltransferase [Ancylomarina salipaludis]
MNVLIVVYPFSGAMRYVEELTSFLITIKDIKIYKLHLWSQEKNEYCVDSIKGIKEVYFPYPKYKCNNVDKYYNRVIDVLVKDFDFASDTICHINSSYHLDFGICVKTRCKFKLIFTLHFLHKDHTLGALKYTDSNVVDRFDGIDVEKFKKYDRIICVTEFAKKMLNNKSNIPSSNVVTVYNGFKGYLNIPESASKDKIKSDLGISNHEKIILYVGRVIVDKGITQLIKAFQLLDDCMDNCRLVVVGDGDSNLIDKNIEKIVWTGKISQEELAKYYTVADIGIIPSHYEQCSYVVLEMMSMKLPVIMSDIPGLNELSSNGSSAFLSKINMENNIIDEVELSNNIAHLLKYEQFKTSLGERGYKAWVSKYTSNRMGAEVLDIYNETIS